MDKVGFCFHGHKLTPDNVIRKIVKWKNADGSIKERTVERCKTCQQNYNKASQERRKDRKDRDVIIRRKGVIPFRTRMAKLLAQGERELHKAKEEGWIK